MINVRNTIVVRLFLVLFVLTVLVIPGAVNAIGSIPLTVYITGLGSGETATLRIGQETGVLEVKNALFEYQIQGTGGSLTEDITPILEDGYYLLLLEAPHQYFREPKGYLFNVLNSAIINPRGRTITFNLKPQPSYLVSEGVVDLSAPPKEPIPFTPRPLWQRLLEPSAILLSVIIVVAIGFIIWRRRSKTSH